MDKVQLVDRCAARRDQMSELDQTGRLDEIDRQLDANGLQRVLVRKVVLHQRVAIDERYRPGHGNLR